MRVEGRGEGGGGFLCYREENVCRPRGRAGPPLLATMAFRCESPIGPGGALLRSEEEEDVSMGRGLTILIPSSSPESTPFSQVAKASSSVQQHDSRFTRCQKIFRTFRNRTPRRRLGNDGGVHGPECARSGVLEQW